MPMPAHPPKNAGSPFSSMIGHHVAVRVPDFDAARTWFLEKLDWRVLHEWPYGGLRLAYLAPPDDDTFHIEILAGPGAAPTTVYDDVDAALTESGYNHVCLSVDSVDDTLAELRRRGVTVLGEPFELEDISRRLAFFSDPWGNLFELSEVIGHA